jgi:hypothetical protein
LVPQRSVLLRFGRRHGTYSKVAEEGLVESSSNPVKYRVGKMKVSNTTPNTTPKHTSDVSEPHSKREQQRMYEAALDWLSGIEHIDDVATINPADLPW